jgi:hypothetical protein
VAVTVDQMLGSDRPQANHPHPKQKLILDPVGLPLFQLPPIDESPRHSLRQAADALKEKASVKTPRWQLQILSSADSDDGIVQPPIQAADPNLIESSRADM